MVAFLAQVLVWGTFTGSKLCTVNVMQQHSYGSTVWGEIRTHLMFLKGVAFSKLWGRLCDGNMSSLPQWTWMPLFSWHFSTPLVSESSPAGAALPSPSSHHGQKTGQCSTQMWWRESQKQAMVSQNTVWIVQSLEQPEVANTKVDVTVGMKEVMYNLVHQ